ncbi:hypothetical protein PIB30_093424 [Stylosanthes scabra]|uniref:Uncharacterized protein n=1 Tax=Stylosanthes scabra TaxID=79078 RepID=A0ABU6QWI3_9FABA|nr:hypothetical protein [Stylosanthes scabra]
MAKLHNHGTLANKTPEEAWLLISDVADANQHFKTIATTSKSLFEVSSSESSILAKALGEIASTLKEIRQGQQAFSNAQRPQPPSQLGAPPRVCGICACNSHYTDECPQLQDDNTLAATNPLPNRAPYHPNNQGQYGNSYNQGWMDNSNQRWNQPQQNQAYHNQPHYNQQTYQNPLYQPQHQNQPYQPQNQQRYQPPHLRPNTQNQQTSSQPTIEEAPRPIHQEQKEFRDFQR